MYHAGPAARQQVVMARNTVMPGNLPAWALSGGFALRRGNAPASRRLYAAQARQQARGGGFTGWLAATTKAASVRQRELPGHSCRANCRDLFSVLATDHVVRARPIG